MCLLQERPVGHGDSPVLFQILLSICEHRQTSCLWDTGGTTVSICLLLGEEIEAFSESGTCLKPHTDGAFSPQ